MDISRIIITTMLLSGGLCGITGVIQAAGVNKTLTTNVSSGYGFTAIITTYLSGLNATKVLFVFFPIWCFTQGGSYIQSALQIPHLQQTYYKVCYCFVHLAVNFCSVQGSLKKNSVSSEVK